MDSNQKVSVIIATYNCAEYLPFAVDSVLVQTYPNIEVIIVNDGSTDHTEVVVAKYGTDVTYLAQENRGPGAARNAGIQASNGDYLVFLDADDLLQPQMLEVMIGYLDTHPAADIVYCDGYLFENCGDKWIARRSFSDTGFLDRRLGSPEQSLPVLLSHNAFPIHAGVIRRSRILEVGGFDEDREMMVFADWDLWYRLAVYSCFEYIDQKLVLYRVVNSGISHDLQKLAAACQAIERKIQKTPGYTSASSQERSRLYIELGKLILRAGDRATALRYFRQALQYDSYPVKTWVAYLTTYLIGQDALLLSNYFNGLLSKIPRKRSSESPV